MAVIGIDGRSLDVERTGIGRYLENLLREWGVDARGHALRVYGMAPQALPVEHRVVRFESPTQTDLFAAELARDPVDAFFSPLYELPDAVTAPAVITVHDLVHEATPEAFDPIQLDWLRRRHAETLPRARAVVTDSGFARDEIAARFPQVAARLHVIPLAADPRFSPARDPAADRAAIAAALPDLALPYFLYVGAISGKRHVPSIVEAFLSSARLEGTQLCLIGRNYLPRPQELDDVLAAAPPGRVVARPHVPNEVLVPLYRQARALVYLSTYEGFGMPPLEAMACGTPAIVAEAASLPEVVGDAARRVRAPWDRTEVRRALEALVEDEPRRELARRGLARAAAFSWRDTAARTLDVIEDVLRA